jgi:hypothetical protein
LHTHIEFAREGFSRIAAKGWQAYLKEERHNKSPQIGWGFIEIIFKVIKWIIYSIEKLGFRTRRIVQMISVE